MGGFRQTFGDFIYVRPILEKLFAKVVYFRHNLCKCWVLSFKVWFTESWLNLIQQYLVIVLSWNSDLVHFTEFLDLDSIWAILDFI